jgi:hypothetical protein
MRDRASDRSRWLVALSVLLVGLVVVIAMAAALAPSLLPAGDRIGVDGRRVAAGVIFVGSYFALAIGRIPGLSIDRAGIALVGAGLMVGSGDLSLDEAYKAIDAGGRDGVEYRIDRHHHRQSDEPAFVAGQPLLLIFRFCFPSASNLCIFAHFDASAWSILPNVCGEENAIMCKTKRLVCFFSNREGL